MAYTLEGETWGDRSITWSFAGYNYAGDVAAGVTFSNFVTESKQQAVIASAFAKWQSVSGLVFRQVSDNSNNAGTSDIRLAFGDVASAGLGTNTIGLTNYTSNGTFFAPDTLIRFEDPASHGLSSDSTLTYTGTSTELYQVALHEIGHALGLNHDTSDTRAVMYPSAGLDNRDLSVDDIAGIQSLYGPPNGLSPNGADGLTVQNTTTRVITSPRGVSYTGPVPGLQDQYINITADNLNIAAVSPNWFLHSGSGQDALDVSIGNNVLDGGTGSNFLVGGTGLDTFFVDDRSAPSDIWSTIVHFHVGDSATVWGVTAFDHSFDWEDGQGASGYTGLTLHATAPNAPTASLTLNGFSKADLLNGQLSIVYGSSNGSSYMFVHDAG